MSGAVGAIALRRGWSEIAREATREKFVDQYTSSSFEHVSGTQQEVLVILIGDLI